MRWALIWRVAVRLVNAGERVKDNLTNQEWQDLGRLVRKALTGPSKRRPWTNLTKAERKRLLFLVRNAITGKNGKGRGKGK